MTLRRCALVVALALLVACEAQRATPPASQGEPAGAAPRPEPAPAPAPSPPPPPPETAPPTDTHHPTKAKPGGDRFVQDSVYLPVERTGKPPQGYGLYTVLLARSADAVTTRLLSELFTVTVGAGESASRPEDLNLITIPVKRRGDAARVLADAHAQPASAAAGLLRTQYDFGQATMLMDHVCRSAQDKRVAKACGSAMPDGPLLVTTLLPLDGTTALPPRLLVVNLASTPPDAVREVLDVYRRQLATRPFDDRGDLDGWRLRALDAMLEAASFLPVIRKSYAATA